MTYRYDAFFSYKRDPQSNGWHETLKDKLEFWLRQELNKRKTAIFFDSRDIRTGEEWRRSLGEALRTSQCIICLWSPDYFQSTWCVSEWQTFRERERVYRTSLVLPAAFHDGDHFPPEARAKQHADFSGYTSTIPIFWNSPRADEFEQMMIKAFARDLAHMIRRAPPYTIDFPLIEASGDQVATEETIGRPGTN